MTRSPRGSARPGGARSRAAAVGLGALVVALAGCSGSDAAAGGGGGGGEELTMWVRDSTDDFSQRLVDTYNATGASPAVKLTVIPDDSYLQKVGAAAGSNSLPDILASDVVYAPNYVTQGLYVDITEKVEGLEFYDTLVQAHTEAASLDGKIYAVPHKVDSSLIVYNKDLYTAAGLDPEKPPTTFEEVYQHAKAIRALGGDTYGFYFGGSCAGCFAYTGFPYAAAAGTEPFTDDGTTADFDNEGFNQAWALYKRMVAEDIAPTSAKSEDGSTWQTSFLAGKVGILPIGSFVFSELYAQDAFEWGVAPLMAPDGSGTATFVGGDVLGVSASSERPDEAFEFVEWSLGDEAQVEVIAKNGDLPGRTDLADNQYSAADPRIQATVEGLANGYTPAILPYGELINNANGPWIAGVRGAIYGEDPEAAVAEMQAKIQAGLDASGS